MRPLAKKDNQKKNVDVTSGTETTEFPTQSSTIRRRQIVSSARCLRQVKEAIYLLFLSTTLRTVRVPRSISDALVGGEEALVERWIGSLETAFT